MINNLRKTTTEREVWEMYLTDVKDLKTKLGSTSSSPLPDLLQQKVAILVPALSEIH